MKCLDSCPPFYRYVLFGLQNGKTKPCFRKKVGSVTNLFLRVMRVFAWVLGLLGCLNLLLSIATFSIGLEVIGLEGMCLMIGVAICFVLLGSFLLSRASVMEADEVMFEKWTEG